MENLLIYKIYHTQNLLNKYPFINDGLRKYVNTEYSEYGKYFNEYCGLLENYKEIPDNIEYIGLEHYRRTFKDINIYNYKDYLKTIENQKACIIYEIVYNVNQCPYLITLNLLNIHNYIAEFFKIKNNQNALNSLSKNTLIIRREMFIMHKTYVIEMINDINECINYVFNKLHISSPNGIKIYIDSSFDKNFHFFDTNNNKYRLFAYVIEFLIDIWIRTKMDKFILVDKIKI